MWEKVGYIGASGKKHRQLASRSVLKYFTDDAVGVLAKVGKAALLVELIGLVA